MGLFHTQMTALKMMFGVFWGKPASTVSLCQYANLLRCKKITKKVLDFHYCNQFFLTLVERFWLALIATKYSCNTWKKLEKFMAKENWHAIIDRVTTAYTNSYIVYNIMQRA